MDAENLDTQKKEKEINVAHIIVFALIVALMVIFVLALLYQWYSHPAPYAFLEQTFSHIDPIC